MNGTSLQETTLERPDGEVPPTHDASSYVLVVDDESVVRDFLARCLEGWGYTTRKVGSAAEALELMVERPPSLVLCDIKMPGQDGLWLADRLRAHWPTTPVVMVTAMDDVESVRESRQSGAVDYITKPINTDQLLQIVRRVATTRNERIVSEEPASPPSERLQAAQEIKTDAEYTKTDAEYTLECPVRCPSCGERITSLKAIRLVRAHVNFISTLPRRGRVVACPHCLAVIPAELTNF
jgi:CheY-like chemotaxis protein